MGESGSYLGDIIAMIRVNGATGAPIGNPLRASSVRNAKGDYTISILGNMGVNPNDSNVQVTLSTGAAPTFLVDALQTNQTQIAVHIANSGGDPNDASFYLLVTRTQL